MKQTTQTKLILGIAYAYLLLPFLIFSIGWMKPIFSIPIALILIFCYLKIIKEAEPLWFPAFSKDNLIKILFILGVIALWVYMSGIGKFVYQNTDHIQRNAIFNILVDYDWPVINHEILPMNTDRFSATGLIYYIGYWLPSAVIGKLLGLRYGYWSQALWAVLGISLVYYFICAKAQKLVIWPLWILIFFSGLDCIGIFFTSTDIASYSSIWHTEWWGTPYQYSSMTTQLFWVFNQAIPAWLCTMLVLIQKNNRNLILILATCMLTSTFPFVGLLLLVAFLCFTRKYDYLQPNSAIDRITKIKLYATHFFQDTFTIQNVLAGGIIGIVSFLYLIGNSSGGRVLMEDPRGPAFYNSLPKLVLFLITEVAIYAVLLYKYNKDNLLFYFTVLCLCIIPPIKVGSSNDFCMRVSIPLLFVLMMLVIETLSKAWKQKDRAILVGLTIVLLLGSVTPILELKRTWTLTYERINAGQMVSMEDDTPVNILNYDNFSGNIETNLFYKYLAK